ncbi:stealth conserved region 3 domain-containing protein [Glutamicibacter arilaitensis]|uniref:stealth conserved region 3 domain-containing protein n=1 Tax=Glutamicibacter arilaitensis TaxID=256701 RepID=UPI003FD5F25A
MSKQLTGQSQLKAKNVVKKVLPTSLYRKLRSAGLRGLNGFDVAGRRAQLLLRHEKGSQFSCEVRSHKGLQWKIGASESPSAITRASFEVVTNELSDAEIEWWLVGLNKFQAAKIGLNDGDRAQALDILSRIDIGAPLYAKGEQSGVLLPVSTLANAKYWAEDQVISVFGPQAFRGSNLLYGVERGCEIEFWKFETTESGIQVTAPRENRASRLLSLADAELVNIDTRFGAVPTLKVLTETMIDDLTFPIDAVYTWVDGDDPIWMSTKRRREAELAGIDYHEEANHTARFRSRDELKYSLRSLQMFAPWFRKIFIVTAGQTPRWLDTSDPRIEIVDHKDIYPGGDYLPTFNSNSIISRLHHIAGLSEHYVYINDDVFFGRDVVPEQFFTPTGIAKVSPSNNRRPFGESTLLDEPHLNLTRNIRRLLKERFGVTVSRAIKHTPHPQLKSVHFEMEAEFRDEYEKTWASPFRDHRDLVSDQLHHYYAQITGRAIPTRLRYHYINILDDQYRLVMENTLRLRDRDTFCINDAPVPGATPIDDEFINQFLESYFPVKSDFEK